MIVVAIIGIVAYKYRSHWLLSDGGQNGKVYVDTVQLSTTTTTNKDNKKVMSAIVSSNDNTVIETIQIEEGLINPSASIQSQSRFSNTVLQRIVDAKERTKPSESSSPTAMHVQPSVSLASELVDD